MSVSDLIERLKKYHEHFNVELFLDGFGETEDATSEICDVLHFINEKTVYIEMLTRPLCDGTGILRKHPSRISK